jgi:hypothetical protein
LQSVCGPAKVAPACGGGRGIGNLRGSGVATHAVAGAIGALASTLALLVTLALGLVASPAAAGPTPEEYISHVGGDAKIIPAGELKLDGYRLVCGQRPTVLDNNLDDYGAAYPGFLILNPKLLAKVSLPVKLWIHAHECGHQFRGPDEETADCFAVQRGRRQRWLTPDGLEEVCRFISPAKGDSMHFSGSHRCEAMRECYADPAIR